MINQNSEVWQMQSGRVLWWTGMFQAFFFLQIELNHCDGYCMKNFRLSEFVTTVKIALTWDAPRHWPHLKLIIIPKTVYYMYVWKFNALIWNMAWLKQDCQFLFISEQISKHADGHFESVRFNWVLLVLTSMRLNNHISM